MTLNALVDKFNNMSKAMDNLRPAIEEQVRTGYDNIIAKYQSKFKYPTGRTENAVRYAIEDREGRIWVHNERAYIARFHETGTVKMQPPKWIFKDERDRIRKEMPGVCVKMIMAGFHG